jgi:hypothetical protein
MFDQFAFEYAGFAFGDGTSYPVDGKHALRWDSEGWHFSARVLVQDPDRDTFITACVALEDAFRVQDGAFEITLAGETMRAFGGSRVLAESNKEGHDADTARSRFYTVSIAARQPSATNPTDGITLVLHKDASERCTATFQGTTVEGDGDTAAEIFASVVEPFIASEIAALDGEWELIEHITTPGGHASDGELKRIFGFQITYRRIDFNQAQGTLDHPAIVEHHIVLRASVPYVGGPHPSGTSVPPTIVRAGYTGNVKWSAGGDVRAVYESVIKPYLRELVSQRFGGSASLVDEAREFVLSHATVAAEHTYEVVTSPGTPLEYRVEQRVSLSTGVRIEPIYADDPTAADVFDGAHEIVRSTSVTTVWARSPDGGDLADVALIGAVSSVGAGGGGGQPGWTRGVEINESGWVLVAANRPVTMELRGDAQSRTPRTAVSWSVIERWVGDRPTQARPSPSPAPRRRPPVITPGSGGQTWQQAGVRPSPPTTPR